MAPRRTASKSTKKIKEATKKASDFYANTFSGNDSEMMLFEARKASFDDRWPYHDDSSINAEKMADAGFYFVCTPEDPDLVRCYYCRKEMSGWEPNDVPRVEHMRSNCSYIKIGKAPSMLTIEEMYLLESERRAVLWEKVGEQAMEEFMGKEDQK